MRKILIISFQSLTKTDAGGTGKIAYHIAQELANQGHLVSLIVSSKGKFDTNFPSKPVSIFSRYYLWLLNHLLSKKLISAYHKRYFEERLFDFFCQKHISDEVRLVISTNPFILKTLGKVRRKGIRSVLVPGNPADTAIYEKVVDEKNKWSLSGVDAYTFKPRISYFDKSVRLFDHIICHSSVIQRTFIEQYQEKNITSCFGVLWVPAQVQIGEVPKKSKFIVLYVAYTVLLKGLQYLLRAWENLKIKNMELWIIGSLDPMIQNLIAKEFYNLSNVKFYGNQRSLSSYFSEASLFVAPSLIEGGPVTVLEAMSHKLPVLITNDCGVRDIIEDGKNGFIIPAKNSVAIAEHIEWAFHNPDELRRIGIEGHQTLQDYRFRDFVKCITSQVIATNERHN